MTVWVTGILLWAALLLAHPAWAADVSVSTLDYTSPDEAPPEDPASALVEDFTAHTLPAGEIQLGTELDIGLTDRIDIGTDLVSAIVGAPSLKAKMQIHEGARHKIALGIRAAYLSKKTLLWGSVNDHFETLEAKIVRPSISWTHQASHRLSLHAFWAKGLGKFDASLSALGQQKLWETKHPGKDYASRDEDTQAPQETEDETSAEDAEETADETQNQEKTEGQNSSLHHQSIQVQSITGLVQDRFQMTGEYQRIGGNKVLITTRIEQATIEKLKSNSIRLTVAHQWIWKNFQMRLGVGAQYFVMSGEDLDGEVIDKTDIQPASDISFYWRF